MTSSELVELIRGLYDTGVQATVTVNPDGSVEVDVTPSSIRIVDIPTPPPFVPTEPDPFPYRPFPGLEPYCGDPIPRDLQTFIGDPPEPSPFPGGHFPSLKQSWWERDGLAEKPRTVCLDPDKMNGAGDQFPGSDY